MLNAKYKIEGEVILMKYCDKCGKACPDQQIFCSECGNKLTNDTEDFQTFSSSHMDTSPKNSHENSKNSSNGWLPVILAGVGALIGWYLSGLLGFALGAVGVGMVMKENGQGRCNQLVFILTWVLAAVDTVFWMIAMFA